MTSPAQIAIKIDRDSVHAGDDTEPHQKVMIIDASSSIADLLQAIHDDRFLASIMGGEATWIIDRTGSRAQSLGVVAQQWQEPKLTIRASMPVSELLHANSEGLHFRYWCQSNPDEVFNAICDGTPLPKAYR